MTTYKQAITNYVSKIGGNMIDVMQQDFMSKDILPQWVNDLAHEYDKPPSRVAKDLIQYRNSWKYQSNLYATNKKGIK